MSVAAPNFTILDSKDASTLHLFSAMICNSCWITSNEKDFIKGGSWVNECLCCKQMCYLLQPAPKDEVLGTIIMDTEKGILLQIDCICCSEAIIMPKTCMRGEGHCACCAMQGAFPLVEKNPITCAYVGLACFPVVGCCVKKADAWK